MNNLLLLKFTSVKVSLETYNHYSFIFIQTGAPVRSAASMLSGKRPVQAAVSSIFLLVIKHF